MNHSEQSCLCFFHGMSSSLCVLRMSFFAPTIACLDLNQNIRSIWLGGVFIVEFLIWLQCTQCPPWEKYLHPPWHVSSLAQRLSFSHTKYFHGSFRALIRGGLWILVGCMVQDSFGDISWSYTCITMRFWFVHGSSRVVSWQILLLVTAVLWEWCTSS